MSTKKNTETKAADLKGQAKTTADSQDQASGVQSQTDTKDQESDTDVKSQDSKTDTKSQESDVDTKDQKKKKEPKEVETKSVDKTIVKSAKVELDMMDRLKTDKLFKNSKGEYFTSYNLAVLSESGERKNVSEINRNVIELIAKQ